MDRLRADKVLCTQLPEWSRSRVQKLFDAGLVWRDDEALSKSEKLRSGDLISYEIPPATKSSLTPADIPLEVIFEDEDLLAINKAPGMVTHPGAGTGQDTLVHALLHHCKGALSSIGGEERPGIVHRLDKDTSGVIVVAKSDRAYLALSEAFAQRNTNKCYLAIVAGQPGLPGGNIDQPIGRHPANRLKMCIRRDGRPAQSDWELVSRIGHWASTVKVRIHTGRTHQVRVHMAHIGLPLCGDSTYGWQANSTPAGIVVPRVMLHAWKLQIPHPVSGEMLNLEAPIPEDFRKLTS